MSKLLQLYLQFTGGMLIAQTFTWLRYGRPKLTARLLGLIALIVVLWPWYVIGMVLDLWLIGMRVIHAKLREHGMGQPAIFTAGDDPLRGGMIGIAVSFESPPGDEARWRPEDDEDRS